jgi:filamentous hemagglutinin family protein
VKLKHKEVVRRIAATFTVCCFITTNYLLIPALAFADQIVVSGQTQTNLAIHNNVTDVTTGTILGKNALNSFSKFDVYQGNVVNLHVPGGASNLLNLVHDQTSHINGLLNSIQNGKIGGNIFFLNPHGFVVSPTGVVNVGSFTVSTPTQDFMNGFFDSPGTPNPASLSSALDGTLPISPTGLISIQGRVNTHNNIRLNAGQLVQAGTLTSGANYFSNEADFSDLVNANGLQSGSQIVEQNGDIYITALGDITHTGTTSTNGGDNLNAGNIEIRAGNDISVAGNSIISAQGQGEISNGGNIVVFADHNATLSGNALIDASGGTSGGGGFIEFSAKDTVVLSGGSLQAGAINGQQGSILIDPLNLVIDTDLLRSSSNTSSDGITWNSGSLTLEADNKITVNANRVISSRQVIAGIGGQTERDAHINNLSIGNSGTISLAAKQIELNTGSKLLAHASSGFTAGDITLTATDDAILPFFGSFESQEARIDIFGAELKGKNINLIATADDKLEYENQVASVLLGFLDALPMPFVDVSISRADALIALDQGANISASGEVNINATANADASINVGGPGFAFGYGKATAVAKADIKNATITAGGPIAITTQADSKTNVEAQTLNLGNLNPGAQKYAELAMSVATGKTESKALIGSASTVTSTGGGLTLEAKGSKDVSSKAEGGSYDDGTAGAALSFSFFTSDIEARVDGRADAQAGNVDINAALTTLDNSGLASSGSGRGFIGKITELNPTDDQFFFNRLSDLVTKPGLDKRAGGSQSLGLSASFLRINHDNTIRAGIGNGGHVTASGDLNIHALSKEGLSYRSTAAVDKGKLDGNPQAKKVALSASVSWVDLDNKAEAFIDDNATVDVGGAINALASSDVPVPWLAWGDWSDVVDFQTGVDKVFDLLTDPTFSTITGISTSTAESDKFSLSGSFNFFNLDNQANAWIGDNAKINTNTTITGANDINLVAKASQGTVNLAGVISKSSSGNGFGGSLVQMNFTGGADTYIGTGAEVNANNLALVSLTEINNINIALAGGKSGKVSFSGAFSLAHGDFTTTSQIAAGSTVDANNILISAKDDTRNTNVAGGVGIGSSAGIGVSTAVNEVVRNVSALIGNRPMEVETGGTVTARGNLLMDASTSGLLGSYSLAGSAAVEGAGTDTTGSKDTKKGKAGIGFSADVSVNTIEDTTEATVSDGVTLNVTGTSLNTVAATENSTTGLTEVNWGGTGGDYNFDLNRGLYLTALNNTKMQVFSGAVTIGTTDGSGGFAGSFSFNDIFKKTYARILNATVNANDIVDLSALNDNGMFAIGASGSGQFNSTGVSIVGQYAQNDVDNETKAYLENSTVTLSDTDLLTDEVRLKAEDKSTIHAVAGAVALGGKAGIGLSIGDNTIDNTTSAYAKNTNITAGKLSVEALNENEIRALAATLTASTQGAGSGSLAVNNINNTASAYLDNTDALDKSVNISDETLVSSKDQSDIEVLVGSIAGASSAAIGASISVNNITNTMDAYIKNVTQDEVDNTTTVQAENDARIAAFTGTVGVATSGGAGGAAISVNRIANTVNAYTTGASTDYLSKNITLKSISDADIENISIAFAGGSSLAVGGSVTTNFLNNNVSSYIKDGAKVKAENNVGILAESDDRISIAAGSAGVGLSGGGVGISFIINKIGGSTSAYIDGADTEVTAKAKDGADILTVNNGHLVDDIDLGEQLDISKYNKLDLKSKKLTKTVTGLAVNASSTQHIESVGVNVAGGSSLGVGLIETISIVQGATESYISGAKINQSNTGAGSGQQVHVDASNHAFGNTFVGNLTAGQGAVGVAEDLHSMARTTRAYTIGGSIKTLGDVSVNAIASQGVSSIAVGGAVGNIGGAGTLSMVFFDNLTESSVDGTAITASDLTVKADNDNRVTMLNGGVSVTAAGGFGGAFAVTKSNSTTRATVRNSNGFNRLSVSGNVNIEAENDTTINHKVVAAGVSGGVGIAGMATINIVTDTTEALLENSELGTDLNRAASLNVLATHNLDINTRAGSLGVGLGTAGVGVGASVNVIKSRTTATIIDSDVYTTGLTEVNAISTKTVDVLALGLAGGSTVGIGGSAAVTVIGDDVKDEGAEEADNGGNGTVTAADSFARKNRFNDFSTDDDSVISDSEEGDVNAATQTSVKDVATGNDPTALKFRTSAEISGMSNIHAGSLNVIATDKTHAKTVVGGLGLSLGGGIGSGVGVTNIKANVVASISSGSTVTTTGAVDVSALAEDNNGSAVDTLALAGGGGLVGIGAAVSVANINNSVVAEVGGIVNATGGKVTIKSEDVTSISSKADGAAIGAGAVGAVVSHASKTSHVDARTSNGTTITANSAELDADSSGLVGSRARGAAAGLVTGNGADALSKDLTIVQAFTGSNNTFNLIGAMDVDATVSPQLNAEAVGVSVGAGLSIGVSIAQSIANNAVLAQVGADNTVNADSLSIRGELTQGRDAFMLEAPTARSKAFGASGSLSGSANATFSEARETGIAQAFVGDNSTLNINGVASLNASTDTFQKAEVDGYNLGLSVAVGSNVAKADYDTQQLAGLGAGVNVNAALLNINAGGTDENYADSLSGSGSLLASLAASRAETNGTSTTKAFIDDGMNDSLIEVGQLNMTADHTAQSNAKANSFNAGLLGMSGATTTNNTIADVLVDIGNDLDILAEGLSVQAMNNTLKPDLLSPNVKSGSGGFLDLPAITSRTDIEVDTDVIVGTNSTIVVTGDRSDPGDFAIKALNNVQAYDKVEMTSGGAIPIASAESEIHADNMHADVTIGSNSLLESIGDINLIARSDATLDAFAHVETYGLAGAGDGRTVASAIAHDKVTINSDANVRAARFINLLAGADESGLSIFDIDADTRVFNRTLIAFSGNLTADATAEHHSLITVQTNADVASGRHMTLQATKGHLFPDGDGRAIDLAREAAAEIAGLFGADASFETRSGNDISIGEGGLIIDGDIQTGIFRKIALTFDNDFSPYFLRSDGTKGTYFLRLDDSPDNPDATGKWALFDPDADVDTDPNAIISYLEASTQTEGIEWTILPDQNLGSNLRDIIQELETTKAQYGASNPELAQDIDTRLLILNAQLEATNADEFVDIIEVQPAEAAVGNIIAWSDYIAGDGSLFAPGDAEIKITNNSPLPLKLKSLTIPDEPGGRILFNNDRVSTNADIISRNLLIPGAPATNLMVTDATGQPVPQILATNTFDPLAGASNPDGIPDLAPPDLFISEAINNINGLVRIDNQQGSIIATASIRADTVQISAGGDFVFDNPEALLDIGPNPQAGFSSIANAFENGSDSSGSRTTATQQSSNSLTVAGNSIFINADTVNINGVIQSGLPDKKIVISQAEVNLANFIGQLTGQRFVTVKVVATSLNSDRVVSGGIKAELDRELGQIRILDADVKGGTVLISGRIASTGDGKINVIDGFGRIEIDNQSVLPVLVQAADTGGGIEGEVILIDKFKDNGTGLSLVTRYERIGNDINIFDNSGVDSTQATELVSSTTGRTSDYSPQEGGRYFWMTGKSTTTQEERKWRKEHDSWLGFIPGKDRSFSSSDVVSGFPKTSVLDKEDLPLGDIISIRGTGGADYTYLRKNVTTDALSRISRKDTDSTKWVWGGFCGCIPKKLTVWNRTEIWSKGFNTFNYHSIRADRPIDIHFVGLDEGILNIQSVGDVLLGNGISNIGGATNILSLQGSILNATSTGSIKSGNLNLFAPLGSVGNAGGALRLNQGAGDTVSVAALGDVYLSAPFGDLLVNSLVTGGGVINLFADNNLDLTNTTSIIKGSSIWLEARNGELGLNGRLRIDTDADSGGTLNVFANSGDINLEEVSGDLRIERIRTPGDVDLLVNGNVIDANNEAVDDTAAIEEFEKVWDELRLQGLAADTKRDEQLAAYKVSRESQYQRYWDLRNVRQDGVDSNGDPVFVFDAFDPNFEFTGADSGTNQLRTQEYFDGETLFGNNYDPNFSYDLSTDPNVTGNVDGVSITTGYQWTEAELKNRLPVFAFKENPDTTLTIENANIEAANVKIVAGGQIGSEKEDIVLDLNGGNPLTDELLVALAAAERDDLIRDDVANTLTILQREDVDIEASGSIDLTASSHIFLGAETDVNLYAAHAGDNLRVKVQGSIFNARTDDLATLKGTNFILEAAKGSIGTALNPIRMDQVDGSALVARAQDSIFLSEVLGDMSVDTLFSQQGIINLHADGKVLDLFNDQALDIQANSIFIDADGGIGLVGGPNPALDVKVSQATGRLTLSSINGGAYIFTSDTQLPLGTVGLGGDLVVESLGILTAHDAIATGGNVLLSSIGLLNTPGSINAQGNMTMNTLGALTTHELLSSGGNMSLQSVDSMSIGGPVNVLGSINMATQNALTVLTAVTAGAGVQLSSQNLLNISGSINAQGNINMSSLASDIQLNLVATIADVNIDANGSILNRNTAASENIIGNNFTLNAFTGSIGEPTQRLVGRSSGTVNLFGATGIHYEDRSGMQSGSITSNGPIDLLISGGPGIFNTISTPDTVNVNLSGDFLGINSLFARAAELRVSDEGGILHVRESSLSERLFARADFLIFDMLHNSNEPNVLQVNFNGNDDGNATLIDINSDSQNITFENMDNQKFDVIFKLDHFILLGKTNGKLGYNAGAKKNNYPAFNLPVIWEAPAAP